MNQPGKEGAPQTGFSLRTTSHQRFLNTDARILEAQENISVLRASVKALVDPVQVEAQKEANIRFNQKEFKKVGLFSKGRVSRFPSDNTADSPWYTLNFDHLGKSKTNLPILEATRLEVSCLKTIEIPLIDGQKWVTPTRRTVSCTFGRFPQTVKDVEATFSCITPPGSPTRSERASYMIEDEYFQSFIRAVKFDVFTSQFMIYFNLNGLGRPNQPAPSLMLNAVTSDGNEKREYIFDPSKNIYRPKEVHGEKYVQEADSTSFPAQSYLDLLKHTLALIPGDEAPQTGE